MWFSMLFVAHIALFWPRWSVSMPLLFTRPADKYSAVVNICGAILGSAKFRTLYLSKPDDLVLDTILIKFQKNHTITLTTFSNLQPQEESRVNECVSSGYEKKLDVVLVMHPTKSALVNLLYHRLSVASTTFVLVSDKSPMVENVLKNAWKLRYLYKFLVVEMFARRVYRFHPFISCLHDGFFVEIPFWDVAQMADQVGGYIKNMSGCPLHISMYPREQTAVLLNNGRFEGQDGKMISLLAERMNFTPVIQVNRSKLTYGFRVVNGTYDGTFANLVYGISDISMNGHFVKEYRCDTIELTRQVTSDRVCFLVPKAGVIPPIFAVLKSFQLEVWIMIGVAYALVLVSFCLWAEFYVKYMNRKEIRGCVLGLEIFRMMIAAPSRKRFSRSERILFAFCWFFSTVILNSFQGSLVTFLNTPMHYPDIDTFDDLIASGLPIRTSSMSFRDLLLDDPSLSVLEKRLYYSKNTSMVEDFRGEFAGFQRINVYNLKYYKDIKRQVNGRRVKYLHTMKQCLSSYFISYAIPKNSPYKKRINVILSAVDYGGFIVKWNSDSAQYIFKKYQLATGPSKTIKVFSLHDLECAFFVFIAGLMLSTVVFCVEVAFEWWMKSKFSSRGKRSRRRSMIYFVVVLEFFTSL